MQVSEAARNHCKDNFNIDVKQVMISAALSSESAGKLATTIPANSSIRASAPSNVTATSTSGDVKATSATAGATAGQGAKSSANRNDKTFWFGLIPLAGLGFTLMWN